MTGFPESAAVYELPGAECRAIAALLERLAEEHESAEDPGFLAEARRVAFSCLPVDLIRFLDRFRENEFTPAVVVTGLEIDDERIGPTPAHWDAQPDRRSTLPEESLFVLLGSLLGDVFGWASLQSGHLVHNVVPIRHQEQEQSGHGSHATLAWHTEDGFHPYRCDYLGLMALRNDALVPTTLASVEAVDLTAAQRRTLGEPRFVIRPDNEHLRRPADTDSGGTPSVEDWTSPAPSVVLFGDPWQPYLRIDPIFMDSLPGDEEAREALAILVAQLDTAIVDLALPPGTICFIDNYRAVHGRKAFLPAFDGRDRWLKKIVVTRDLRKSRAARSGVDDRVLSLAAAGSVW